MKTNVVKAGFFTSLLSLFRKETSRSEAQFRDIMECAPDGVCVAEPGGILYVNPRWIAMFGDPGPGGYRGRFFRDLIHEDERAEHDAQTAAFFAQNRIIPPRLRKMRRLDGTPFDTEISAGPIVWNGKPAAVIFCRSIEERRVLEEHLRQVQKMEAVGRLAGGLAHDFNTILGTMALHLDRLRDAKETTSFQREDIGGMEASLLRASNLVRQLLLFGQKGTVQTTPCRLPELVKAVVARLHPLFAGRIEVQCVTEMDLPPVAADPSLIEWVITHLALNARDAMPKGGTVVFSTERKQDAGEDSVRLIVSDTGIGMDEETRRRIFDPFFTTKEVGKGTGLGLSTVHGIVRQHGGTMEVESEMGKGARFLVGLPIYRASKP